MRLSLGDPTFKAPKLKRRDEGTPRLLQSQQCLSKSLSMATIACSARSDAQAWYQGFDLRGAISWSLPVWKSSFLPLFFDRSSLIRGLVAVVFVV